MANLKNQIRLNKINYLMIISKRNDYGLENSEKEGYVSFGSKLHPKGFCMPCCNSV